MTAPATTVTIDMPSNNPVTADTSNLTITRGRQSGVFSDIGPGKSTITLNNEDRRFDPLYASSPFVGQLVPSRQATVVSGGVTIYDAKVSNYKFEYDGPIRAKAIISSEDALAKLGRTKFDEWTTTRGDLPGVRIAAALARPEVNYTGPTSLDPGIFVLADDLQTWGSNVLNYLQLVTRSDQGLLYVDRSGVLTFKDRHAFIDSTPAAAFGIGGIPIAKVTTTSGLDQLFNWVQITRSDPVLDDAPTPLPVTASDPTSIVAYDGAFMLSLPGLLLQDDIQALDLATQLVSVYKDPLYRFESLTINVHALTAGQQALVLPLDIGSVVTATWAPSQITPAITRTCIVEGIRDSIMSGVSHVRTLSLIDSSIAQTGHYWTPGDPVYGVIGAAGSDSTDYPIAF